MTREIFLDLEIFKQLHFKAVVDTETEISDQIKYLLREYYGKESFEDNYPARDAYEQSVENGGLLVALKRLSDLVLIQKENLNKSNTYLNEFINTLERMESSGSSLTEADKVELRKELQRIEVLIEKRRKNGRKNKEVYGKTCGKTRFILS